MGLEMKVEVIHKETIKPASATPHHLTTTKLSFLDQFIPEGYVPLLLFYPNDKLNNFNLRSMVTERSKLLKISLSEALTHFYPFAGKFEYNHSIRCNDHGAAFVVAEVNCSISTILEKPDLGMLKRQLLPNPIDHAGYLLQIQANFFECGGLAIGLNISHKLADASTVCKFISSWAAISLASASTRDHAVLDPVNFGAAASLFPPLDFLNAPPTSGKEFGNIDKCITKRFVFKASKISALRSKAASPSAPNPTRVEVVSALIWKCAMEVSRSNFGSVRPSVWCQAVNMRNIIAQQLADYKDLMGNAVLSVAAKAEEGSGVDHGLPNLVTQLRKGIEEFKVKYGDGVSGEDACQAARKAGNLRKRDDLDNYNCSSWCRFPFYAANFGWGKPCWVFIAYDTKNVVFLMDARDGGGIEAFVTFKEEDMIIFENNKELLEYASWNPTVVI